MKYWLSILPILGIVFVLSGCGSSRIEVTNTGIDVIEVKTDGNGNKVFLGQNGTGYFDRDCGIQIGDVRIRVGRRIEVANAGSEIIRITCPDAKGSEQTLLIGQGGVGYLDKSEPFKIGDVAIRLGRV